MRRLLVLVLFLAACRTAAPIPEASTEPVPDSIVFVTASTLNVRSEASAASSVLTRVKRGAKLTVVGSHEGWAYVKLQDQTTGWVSTQHISSDPPKVRRGCPDDSDFRFAKTPTPDLRPTEKHGLIVIDATVNADGNVTSTKLVSNGTGDSSLAQQAEREIRSAKFVAPVKDCVARTFIFTYKRTF